MYRTVRADVEIDVEDVIGKLDDDDLKELGLRRTRPKSNETAYTPHGFGHETPVQEVIRTACMRGDLPGFIEATRQMLDEEGIFLRVDRLLAKLREPAHG